MNLRKARENLQKPMSALVKAIGFIQIHDPKLFPYGWRKAAKGRTVWRILEEAITQNLEVNAVRFGIHAIEPAESEVSVYDFRIKTEENEPWLYVNIKSSTHDKNNSKDDISKAAELIKFYKEDSTRMLFIATFPLMFEEPMKVSIKDCIVMPINWLPDIYVNPSNNGNLQSSQYKNLTTYTDRDNTTFLTELQKAIKIADAKRKKKEKNR